MVHNSDLGGYTRGYTVMTSRRRSRDRPSDDVTACRKDFSGVMDSSGTHDAFYDDSLRPKSFLHDEVDEFNRVLAELLQSKQKPEPRRVFYLHTYCFDEDDNVVLINQGTFNELFYEFHSHATFSLPPNAYIVLDLELKIMLLLTTKSTF